MKITKEIINRHNARLVSFYTSRGLTTNEAIFYANEKSSKLTDTHSELSYFKLFDRIKLHLLKSDCDSILDVGCGSGEMVIIGSLVGLEIFGCDIYVEELELAKELAIDLDLNPNIFSIGIPAERRFDLITMFSVLEHVPYNNLNHLLNDCLRISNSGLLTIHPGRFKFVDDHTRIPFLGLFKRRNVLKLLKLLNVKYVLSENKEWDVYLRSWKELNLELRDFKLNFINDKINYPPVSQVSQLKFQFSIRPGIIFRNFYFIFIYLFFTIDKEDKFPYHNILITNND